MKFDKHELLNELVKATFEHTKDKKNLGLFLSAGIDSRFILAILLYLKRRPFCITMGNQHKIPGKICKYFKLDFIHLNFKYSLKIEWLSQFVDDYRDLFESFDIILSGYGEEMLYRDYPICQKLALRDMHYGWLDNLYYPLLDDRVVSMVKSSNNGFNHHRTITFMTWVLNDDLMHFRTNSRLPQYFPDIMHRGMKYVFGKY